MISYREFVQGFRELGLDRNKPVIAHASLSAFGEIRGGAETLLGALLQSVSGLMMPAFTYKTLLIPEAGPPDNGIAYGTGRDLNRMAEFFSLDMPADPMMGVLPETLRTRASSKRSNHPILSFTAAGLDSALAVQTIDDPYAPIRMLAEMDGWVLLLGVDHTVNTSIHYAEFLAGRKQFVRWALTSQGVKECPHFPGCSDGFNSAAPYLAVITRQVRIGSADVLALPLSGLIERITILLQDDPLDMLCSRPDCERCNAVRQVSQLVSYNPR
ncbi:MAG TPA: AAC(3) family N-acetyltransferase [Anaerolineaceae bacterium]